jgi:hypothetical protein
MITIRPASPRPARFTRRPRPGGVRNVHQIQIHATRGPTTMGRQVQATENWFATQPDRGGWGASADFVIGFDDRVSDIVVVQFGDWLNSYSSWSAGFGTSYTDWGAAEVGVAIEVAQPPKYVGGKYVGGDSNVAFDDGAVDAVVELCKHINDVIEDAGGVPVPAVHLTEWNQRRTEPVPRGYIGHDELANGVKLGKTDPGQMWDWDYFMSRVARTDMPGLSPSLTNYEAGMAAWLHGVKPLLPSAEADRYELRVPR